MRPYPTLGVRVVEAEVAGSNQAVCLGVVEVDRKAVEASTATKGVGVVAEARPRQASHSPKVPNSWAAPEGYGQETLNTRHTG